MIARSLFSLTLAVAVSVASASCQQVPRGFAAREWSLALREMQIVPVFPPREDVYVGDVHFLTTSELAATHSLDRDTGSGFLPIGSLVYSMDLRRRLETHYSERPSFPATDLSVTSPDSWRQSRTASGTIAFSSSDLGRLRLVGFPEFFSATFSQGDASALVPVEAVQVGVAAGFSRSKKVKVSLPVAESCGLPVNVVLDEYNLPNGAKSEVEPLIRELLATGAEQVADGSVLGHIRILTEVYYARTIDVSVFDSKASGGQLAVKLPIPSTGAAAVGAAAATGAGGSPPATPSETTLVSPQQAADELNRRLASTLAAETPGVKIRFVSAAEGSVGLRRTYERPIAVGYRAVTFAVIKRGEEVMITETPIVTDSWHPTSDGAQSKPAGATNSTGVKWD